jgi:hypothetical protein
MFERAILLVLVAVAAPFFRPLWKCSPEPVIFSE